MLRKEPSGNASTVLVTFEFPAAFWAREVHLVGDFNGWDEEATPLKLNKGGGVWRARLELKKGREYQFRYLVNRAEWHNDWHADRYVPNLYGSDNSVVVT